MRIDFPDIEGTIDIYMDVMLAICGETHGKSMLDLGCCTAPNTPRLGFSKRRYIDIIDRKLDHPEEQQHFWHGNILLADLYVREPVDVAIASDVIEHMLDLDGYKLLGVMEKISQKQILFTPTTDLFGMAKAGDDDPESHRSLWAPEDFPDYASIVFPHYHKTWDGGAFFFFKTPSLKYDFDRVVNELKTKSWAR